ncbi:HNH endonuclease [Nocardia otitidiscaviarum]|uniref:HNH endonuclease signature motif containing protein n=1 Tax=Nocardia otitidiscaviarum TaxID=1823 RepID=UPI001892FC09|nr:HNH endonuclease [Nocardia otitidiscaviarum]
MTRSRARHPAPVCRSPRPCAWRSARSRPWWCSTTPECPCISAAAADSPPPGSASPSSPPNAAAPVPGCDAPAVYCAVHHKREHAADGPTDIDNLTLACDPCHARITNTDHGWTTPAPPRIDGVTTTGLPAIGRATWIAPHHVDPTRTPHINHRHHGDELLARARRQLLADYTQAAEQHRHWLTAADTEPNRSQTPAAANTPGPDAPPRDGPRICIRRPRRGS